MKNMLKHPYRKWHWFLWFVFYLPCVVTSNDATQQTKHAKKETEELINKAKKAIENKNLEDLWSVLESVLEKEASIKLNTYHHEKYTALHLAAEKGDEKLYEHLIKHEKIIDINPKEEKEKWTPLHYASCFNKATIVSKLLEHPKIKINVRAKDNKTPLHLAAQNNCIEVMEVFRQYVLKGKQNTTKGKRGIRLFIEVKDNQNETPGSYAEKNNYKDIVSKLKEMKSSGEKSIQIQQPFIKEENEKILILSNPPSPTTSVSIDHTPKSNYVTKEHSFQSQQLTTEANPNDTYNSPLPLTPTSTNSAIEEEREIIPTNSTNKKAFSNSSCFLTFLLILGMIGALFYKKYLYKVYWKR